MNKLIVFGDANISTTRDLYPALHISDSIKEGHTECAVLSKDPLLNESDRDLLKRARILQFGSSSLKSEPSRSKLYQAIDFAAEQNTIISYAPRIDLKHWQMKDDDLRILRSPVATADVMQVLPQELPFLTGESTPEAAAEILADQGVRLIFVMQSDGVLVRFGLEKRAFPSGKICDRNVFFGEILRRIADANRPLRQIPTDDIMEWTESATAFSCK